jgi:hypothetical protein
MQGLNVRRLVGEEHQPGRERIKTLIPKGYRKTNFESSGQSVFTNGKDFISPDTDGHNGGIWKKAKSVKALGKKETRDGTYDKDLNRIGD